MLHSFIFMRGGKIFTEGYFAPFSSDRSHRMYSTSKTFTSMAIGVLAGEGKISLDDPVSKFFPDKLPENMHPYLKKVTIRDHLIMATSHKSDAYGRYVPDWTFSYFNTEPDHEPGTRFSYDTCGTYMLDAIVERVTGMPFMRYLWERVLKKIGVGSEPRCVLSPEGYSWGGSGVQCTSRDLARFAELVRCRGVFNGEELIPSWYVDKATSTQIDNSSSGGNPNVKGHGYGYQIWRSYENGYSFLGMGTQCAVVLPDKELVAVFTADTQGDALDYEVINVFKECVSDRVGEPYPECVDSRVTLDMRLQSLRVPVPAGDSSSPLAERINSKRIVFSDNPMGIKECRLEFFNDKGAFVYTCPRGEKRIEFGVLSNVVSTFPETHWWGQRIGVPAGREFDCFASGVWEREDTFLLRVYIHDFCLGNMSARFHFASNSVTLTMRKSAEWFLDEYSGTAEGKLL
jgi:CubicO group peptidase (beta-lactamase class C family)